jgi:hypothetical protein
VSAVDLRIHEFAAKHKRNITLQQFGQESQEYLADPEAIAEA